MTRTDIALLVAFATVALIALLLGQAAAADPASCLDTGKSYVARTLPA
jgi:hypothetical protein